MTRLWVCLPKTKDELSAPSLQICELILERCVFLGGFGVTIVCDTHDKTYIHAPGICVPSFQQLPSILKKRGGTVIRACFMTPQGPRELQAALKVLECHAWQSLVADAWQVFGEINFWHSRQITPKIFGKDKNHCYEGFGENCQANHLFQMRAISKIHQPFELESDTAVQQSIYWQHWQPLQHKTWLRVDWKCRLIGSLGLEVIDGQRLRKIAAVNREGN